MKNNHHIKKSTNTQEKSRYIEIFAGAYTSGKSEISINRAFMLNPATLVDLDTVEPAYTLRPLKKELESLGLKVVTQEDYTGLGEAGNVITPTQKNCLSIEGNVVIDVGYGVGGLDILDVINYVEENQQDLNIYMVINTSKHETSTVDYITEYVKWSQGTGKQSWKKFSGIISNTHFGDETTKEDIIRGYEITKKAAEKLDLPIRAIGVADEQYPEFEGATYDGIELWSLKRFMPKALW